MPARPKPPWRSAAFLAIVLSTLLPPQESEARQVDEAEGFDVEARGYLMAGVHSLDLDGLNALLADRDLPEFGQGFVTLGGGGHGRIGRLVLSGEGHALIRDRETAGGFERTLQGGYGLLSMGYIVTPDAPLQVYPLVGLGGGMLQFNMVEIGAPTFEEVLDDPRRGVALKQNAVLLHAGVGADYLVVVAESPQALRGFTVGIRAGYTVSPWESDWTHDDFRIPGGPGIGVTGLYVRVLVGGVGRVRRM